YVLFTWLGFYTQVEVSTAIGRMDMVIYTKTNIYIFEFKLDKSAEEAMKQIHERNYDVKFKNDGREIIKFGINISSETRTIEKWVMEK
ncbi:MAG: PD-(D/E)XK nuclease domain-containing protein, partial [Bacteroidales bacterium]|nr:PD-(D/E)XK nuclease domain-containing protein [Bacteroidales bacterium]